MGTFYDDLCISHDSIYQTGHSPSGPSRLTMLLTYVSLYGGYAFDMPNVKCFFDVTCIKFSKQLGGIKK